MMVMAGAFAAGAISGGVFNPAVTLGTFLVDMTNIPSNLPNLVVFVIGQLLGAVGAATVYNIVTKE
jgi:aquaporin Z